MRRSSLLVLALAAVAATTLGGCLRIMIDPIQVAPINIYAKLDADVRLRLDEDVKSLAQKNPDLF